MSLQQQIENALRQAFGPVLLEVVNESHLHAGHAGDDGTGESHFRITIVAEAFAGKSRVICHRMVYSSLEEKLERLPHALAIKASAPQA